MAWLRFVQLKIKYSLIQCVWFCGNLSWKCEFSHDFPLQSSVAPNFMSALFPIRAGQFCCDILTIQAFINHQSLEHALMDMHKTWSNETLHCTYFEVNSWEFKINRKCQSIAINWTHINLSNFRLMVICQILMPDQWNPIYLLYCIYTCSWLMMDEIYCITRNCNLSILFVRTIRRWKQHFTIPAMLFNSLKFQCRKYIKSRKMNVGMLCAVIWCAISLLI